MQSDFNLHSVLWLQTREAIFCIFICYMALHQTQMSLMNNFHRTTSGFWIARIQNESAKKWWQKCHFHQVEPSLGSMLKGGQGSYFFNFKMSIHSSKMTQTNCKLPWACLNVQRVQLNWVVWESVLSQNSILLSNLC